MLRVVCLRNAGRLGLALVIAAAGALSAAAQNYAWSPQYKLRNAQTAQQTAADFPGPGGADGLVYPNFYYAGLPGGIPAQHPRYDHVVQLASYAGYDNTGATDQWAVITRAIEDLHAQGGGVLEFGAGTFRVNESILIPYDNIVLRGAGRTATKIDFRPGITNAQGEIVQGIKWLYLRDGDTVPHDYLIQVRAMQPSDRWTNDAAFDYIRIFVDGVQRATTGTDRQGGPNLVTLRASDANSGITPNSTHTLMAEVRYNNGAVFRTPTITVRFTDPLPYGEKRLVPANAAISFGGDEWSRRGAAHTFALTADALRGSTTLKVNAGSPANFALIRPGDILLLEKPVHGGDFLVERAASADRGSRYLVTVVGTDGVDTLQIAEPLREDFLVLSQSRVKSQFIPVRNVGVEDLWVDQSAEQVWTSGIHLLNTYQAWVKNVQVTKTGRFPVWPSNSKNVEIRDVVLRDAWYRIGGGTAYIGFGESNDVLLDGVDGSSLRHGPNFGAYASGNVVRNGIFDGMDAHVGHGAWVAENLIELSLIDARQPEDLPAGFGTSYGPAITHEPRDGPQGPRSVFYNNTLKSDPRLNFNRPGIDTSGGMEAMYFIANKIYSPGSTVLGAPRDIDLVFEDNVFIIERSDAGVALMPQDNLGWEFRNNTIYGGTGQLLHPGSTSTPLVNQGNVFLPFDPSWNTSIAAPSPAVPSIYAWQMETKYPAAPVAPPAIVTATPGAGAVLVGWSPVADAAAYVVKWGTSAGALTAESSGHVATEFTVSGLVDGQTYYFAVAAVNPKGRSADSAVASATLSPGQLPLAPSALQALAAGTNRVDLTWTDNANNETEFLLERRNGELGVWAAIAVLPANSSSYADTTLWPNQAVAYRLRARNAAGNSALSNVASATTQNAVPAQPVVFEATAATGQVRLTWSLVYNATSYTLARGTSAAGPFAPLATGLTGDAFTDTSVTNGVTYFYVLTASNDVGASPASAAVSATPNGPPTVAFTAPAPGTALVGPANVTITLNPQDADGTIARVELYNGNTLLATLTSAPYSFTWNNVAPGSYTLRAIAVDNLGATAEATRYLTLVDPATPAQAPLIAEWFDYPEGTLASQMTGGTGLRGAWSGGAVSVAATGSLEYLDAASSRRVLTSGNRLTSGSSTFISGRFTARDPNNSTNPLWPWLSGYGTLGRDGTVFWLSYLLRFDAAPGWAALRTDSGGDELFFGVYQLTGNRLGIQRGQAAGSPVALTDVTPVAGQTYLLVVRYEFGAANNDTVTLWVNPRIDGAVPTGGSSVSMSGVNATWQQISMRGSVAYSVDEIRAGGAFRDVVPSEVVGTPPTIAFTTPTPATTFASPATIPLAVDTSGAVTKVEFFHGPTKLGEDTSAPYAFSWSSVAPGRYPLRAVATGPLGTAEATRFVEVVDSARAPLAPLMHEPFDYATGTLGTAMAGGVGFRGTWNGGANTLAAEGSLTFVDTASGRMLAASGNRLTSANFEWNSRNTARDPNNNTNPLWPWLSGYGIIGKDDTSFWVSFLLRYDGTPGWAGVRLAGQDIFFGAYSLLGGQLGIQIGQSGGSPIYSTGKQAVAGETYLIVVKYEFGAANQDTIRLWVNPRLDRAVPESEHSTWVSGIDASWSSVTTRGSVPFAFDEFRAGAAFTDVTPSIDVGQPPTITLTSPLPATTVQGPASITIAANTTGAVSRVDFYAGATKIGQDTTAPYSFTWTNVPAGNYTLRAVAVSPVNLTAEATRRVEVTDANQVAQPVVIAEPFSYPVGTLGSAMSGGVGLRGTWNGGAGTVAAADSLLYADVERGLRLATSGNRLTSGGSAWVDGRLTARDPNNNTNPLWPWLSGYGIIGRDDTSFWISYLLRYDENPAGKWAALRVDSGGGGAPEMFIGTFTLTGGQIGLQLGQAGGSPVYSTGVVPVAGQTYLLVVKFEFGAANNDTVRLWVNPRLGATAPDSPHTAVVTGINANWQKFTFRGSANYSVDELRGGATFADVVPSVPLNAPPIVTQAASATPAPVTGTSTQLSVRATDDGLPGPLSYTWSVLAAPAGAPAPTFSVNGNATARDTTVTFGAAGDYRFSVVVSDGALATDSAVDVTVAATVTTVAVTPVSAVLFLNGETQFAATARDQFGTPLASTPVFAWSLLGAGTIDDSGRYRASSTVEGTTTIIATTQGVSGMASVAVANATPVAQPDSAATDEGVAVLIDVLANDSDVDAAPEPLSIASVTAPTRGTAVIVDGQVRYTPEPGFHGVDTFSYTATDGRASATAAVSVEVRNTAQAMDLSSVGLTGTNLGGDTGASRILADGTWELTSTGAGFGEFTDELHLELREQPMNFTLTVRVVSVSGTHPEALAGVILRDAAGADARHAMIGVEPGGAVVYGARDEKKRGTYYAEAAPQHGSTWLRLERRGTQFFLSVSTNGVTFTPVDRGELQHLPHVLRIGLFASAGDSGQRARAVFADFSLVQP